jgi:cytoskeletal protein CcmA (bactofilin family)
METLNIARFESGDINVEVASWMVVDTRDLFDQWLEWLQIPPARVIEQEESDVVFNGVLRVEGLVKGSIQSAHGTLVMTEQGHVTADVDVRAAYIDGFLQGNLRATEEVVLDRNARVAGDICTPSLSIKDGAVFEGQSYVMERNVYADLSGQECYSNLPASRLVGAYRQQMRQDQDDGLQFSYKARQ